MNDIVRPALDDYARTLRRQFSHDRTKTIGSSEIGQCARRIWWTKRQDREPDDEMSSYNGHPRGASDSDYGASLRGTVMEDRFWYPAMRARYGRSLRYAGRYQRTFQDGLLSATPDGLIVNAPEALEAVGYTKNLDACFLVECKTIDPRVNLTEEKREHAFQVQQAMGLVRKTTRYKPLLAVISYIDASFWHEVDEYVVEYREDVFLAGEARAAEIFRAERAEDLKPEGWIAGGKECEHCPFWRSCGAARRYVEERKNPDLDPQFVSDLIDLCRLTKAKQQASKNADEEYRSLQDDVKELLRKNGIRKVEGVVNWIPQKGRTSYDMKQLLEAAKAHGVPVDDYCQVGDPTDQLRIIL